MDSGVMNSGAAVGRGWRHENVRVECRAVASGAYRGPRQFRGLQPKTRRLLLRSGVGHVDEQLLFSSGV